MTDTIDYQNPWPPVPVACIWMNYRRDDAAVVAIISAVVVLHLTKHAAVFKCDSTVLVILHTGEHGVDVVQRHLSLVVKIMRPPGKCQTRDISSILSDAVVPNRRLKPDRRPCKAR